MKRILVTSSSSFPDDYVRKFEIDYIPFIKTEIYPKSQFITQIPQDIQSFIVTSKNSAKAIKDIELNGQFFVVGKSTAAELYGQNRKIAFISNYAEDLLERMLETDIKKYIFFKGNLSLPTLPEVLHKNSIEVVDIECYKTILTPQKVQDIYNGIVFMSPSAVESFTQKNNLPQDIPIFTSGETTAQAVKKMGDYKIYYPEESSIEKLMDLINKILNA